MKRRISIVLCALLLTLPSLTAAEGPGGTWRDMSPKDRKERAMKFFKSLDLDEAQQIEMKNFFREREGIHSEMEAIHSDKEELDRLLRSSTTTDTQILAQAEKVHQTYGRFHQKRLERLLEIKKILRPEQFERLLNKLDHMKKTKSGEKFDKMRHGHHK